MKNLHYLLWLAPVILSLAGCKTIDTTVTHADNGPPGFAVSYPDTVRSETATGRVLLFFSKNPEGEPRNHLNFFDPDPVYAIDVLDLKPNEQVLFRNQDFERPDALGFPGPLGHIEPGVYHVQALIDIDNTRRSFNQGPGNLYSEPIEITISGTNNERYELVADQVIKERNAKENEWVKLVKVRSQLLSDFHGRDVYMRASVLLPFGYNEEPDRFYPAYYEVPGFGGRHFGLLRASRWDEWTSGKLPFRGFKIILDPDMPLGHSVFANSANNGPAGDALVRELIPAIESEFRIVSQPHARFIGGHSSGGWSSLWLQVTYPEYFGGCWSTAPDPVDFRAFQTLNIYEDSNGHWTPQGFPRPVGRSRHDVLQTVVAENHWEYVLGYGEQLDSFDAVFSPRGEDGNPMQMTNKLTGRVNPDVAAYWRNYDIRLILEENWPELGPLLQHKLHIVGGAWDTFYLEPALELLKAFLDTKDHGGYVKILPGNHGDFMDDDMMRSFYREMTEAFEQGMSGSE